MIMSSTVASTTVSLPPPWLPPTGSLRAATGHLRGPGFSAAPGSFVSGLAAYSTWTRPTALSAAAPITLHRPLAMLVETAPCPALMRGGTRGRTRGRTRAGAASTVTLRARRMTAAAGPAVSAGPVLPVMVPVVPPPRVRVLRVRAGAASTAEQMTLAVAAVGPAGPVSPVSPAAAVVGPADLRDSRLRVHRRRCRVGAAARSSR